MSRASTCSLVWPSLIRRLDGWIGHVRAGLPRLPMLLLAGILLAWGCSRDSAEAPADEPAEDLDEWLYELATEQGEPLSSGILRLPAGFAEAPFEGNWVGRWSPSVRQDIHPLGPQEIYGSHSGQGRVTGYRHEELGIVIDLPHPIDHNIRLLVEPPAGDAPTNLRGRWSFYTDAGLTAQGLFSATRQQGPDGEAGRE